MDTETGKIYPDIETAKDDLRKLGVPEDKIDDRLIQGTKSTLRKIRKVLKKQWDREHKK